MRTGRFTLINPGDSIENGWIDIYNPSESFSESSDHAIFDYEGLQSDSLKETIAQLFGYYQRRYIILREWL